jgi:hypothetical protein
MLEKYAIYLEKLKTRLDGYFHDQKEYIKCKAGCGVCCTLCYYPVSQLEYAYMKIGAEKCFTPTERDEINQKCIQIIKDRKNFLKTNPNIMDFYYTCPFLVNGSCGNYEHRALLCRSHGLIYQDIERENKHNLPYCFKLGLNYADVWDESINSFSQEKADQLGIKASPKVYDLSYSSLMRDALGVEFGDVRMLVEWIVMDIPNYEELIKDEPENPEIQG